MQIDHQLQESGLAIITTADSFEPNSLTKIANDLPTLTGMLHQAVVDLKLELSANQYGQLLTYLDTLLLWSKSYNLTAITQPTEAMIKHIIDCLAIMPTINHLVENYLIENVAEDVELLDIGAGAGLPSAIIGICQPKLICKPLDSNQKKIRFIRQVASEIGLKNVKPVATRIESFTGEYKLITSRAFASLADFVALATPYVHTSGKLVAMKGKAPLEEETQPLVAAGWHVETIELTVPYLSDSRHLVILSR